MARLWIIHRDPAQRDALARQLGTTAGSEDALLAGPGELPSGTSAPRAVVMGVVDDFEQELHFAHRNAERLADSRWILVASQEDGEDVARLFDLLRAELVRAPARPAELRPHVESALARRSCEPLSQRRRRERVAERFARWFAGFEPPQLLRALDPRLAGTPLLVRGEPGSGRALLARYVHSIGPRADEPLIAIGCADIHSAAALEDHISAIDTGGGSGVAILLEDVDRLPAALQARVREWVEYGPPISAPRVRWLASAEVAPATLAAALAPALQEALAGLEIAIPPLRERPGSARALASATATAWSRARAQRPRAIAEEALAWLEREAWPGNQRELEAAVVSALARSAADPLGADAFYALPQAEEPAQPEQSGDLPLEVADEQAEAAEAVYLDDALSEHERESEPVAATELLEDEVDAILEPFANGGGATAPLRAVEASPEPARLHPPEPGRDRGWQRLVAAVAHEVGNPLVSIRTFAELLPEHYHDEEFRSRFSELVNADVRRIEAVVGRLQNLSLADGGEREPIDVSEMLSTLLEEMRDDIQRRRLLVLKELDRERPFALADPVQLRSAVAGLLGKALSLVAERGDLYLASRYNATGLRGSPCVRVLLRYRNALGGGPASGDGLAPSDHEIDFAFAETVVTDADGAFAVDSHGEDTVVVIDLPAPL